MKLTCTFLATTSINLNSTNAEINNTLCQYGLITMSNHPIIAHNRNGGLYEVGFHCPPTRWTGVHLLYKREIREKGMYITRCLAVLGSISQSSALKLVNTYKNGVQLPQKRHVVMEDLRLDHSRDSKCSIMSISLICTLTMKYCH